jgi:hypothetical protein
MALAIHILAHRQPSQVERLVNAVLRPENVLVLHFDQRAPESLHELGRRLAATHSNVLLQRPRAVVWFGWQGIHIQLEGMALALKHSSAWTHFIMLSGADFPLQSIDATAARLAATPDTSFVSCFDPVKTGQWSDMKDRVELYHLASPLLQRFLRIPLLGRKIKAAFGWTNRPLPWIPGIRRRYPQGWPYLGGSNWCMLARPACEWLTSDPEVARFARWMRHFGSPDEVFFQSTIYSRRHPGKVENSQGHYIEFAPGAPNPRVFTRGDFDRLLASGFPFARKFDDGTDAEILDRLERHVNSLSSSR